MYAMKYKDLFNGGYNYNEFTAFSVFALVIPHQNTVTYSPVYPRQCLGFFAVSYSLIIYLKVSTLRFDLNLSLILNASSQLIIQTILSTLYPPGATPQISYSTVV